MNRSISKPVMVILSCIGMLVSAPLMPWDWPLQEVAVRAGFAHPASHSFSRGMSLYERGASGQDRDEVRTIHQGELLFQFRPLPNREHHPLGDFVVVAHENRVRSLYAHITPYPSLRAARSLETGEAIGTVGVGGYRTGVGMELRVMDEERNSYINPQMILPARRIFRIPLFRHIMLHPNNWQPGQPILPIKIPRGSRNVQVVSGRYRLSLFVDNFSSHTYVAPPLRIATNLGGSGQDLRLDMMHEVEGRLYLPYRVSASDIIQYDEEYRILLDDIEIVPGRQVLTIRLWNEQVSIQRISIIGIDGEKEGSETDAE